MEFQIVKMYKDKELYKNVKNICLTMYDVKVFLTFTSLNLVLLWQLFYLFCSSIVINTVITTAGTFDPYMSSSVLFYLSTDIPGMSSESNYAINVTSVNTYIPSTVMVVSASADTSLLTPSNLSIMGSKTTLNKTKAMTLSYNVLSITSLSPSFVLQSSVFSQSTVRLQSILDPSSSDLISSSVQDLRSLSSSIDTYLTTPNGNYEQEITPIQSAFFENFIIISAWVAGVIIIAFGSLMVLYWLKKLPGHQQHKSNELHRDNKGNNKITKLRTILQRESQNS